MTFLRKILTKTISNALFILAIGTSQAALDSSLNPPAGRIALITDGNAHDPDDVIGTPVAMALLRAAGLADRLVSACHSSELTNKGIFNKKGGDEEQLLRQKFNKESWDETQELWGGFGHLTFWNCRNANEKAKVVEELRTAINVSSATDPLWVLEAGEPDVLYDAALLSDRSKLQFVKVITHHPNNDRGSDPMKSLKFIVKLEDPGVQRIPIPDQNPNLKTEFEEWNWAKVHSDPRIGYLYQRGHFAGTSAFGDIKFRYPAITNKFDCSDAGMALYLITGATDGGLEEGSVEDCRKILEQYVKENP